MPLTRKVGTWQNIAIIDVDSIAGRYLKRYRKALEEKLAELNKPAVDRQLRVEAERKAAELQRAAAEAKAELAQERQLRLQKEKEVEMLRAALAASPNAVKVSI